MLSKRLAIGLLLTGLAGAWWLLSVGLAPALPASATPALQSLMSLSLPDAQGRMQALAQWRGRPLLINFWATWCGPCRAEMPLLAAQAQQQGAAGVQIIGIALDSAANVQAYLQQNPTHYPILIADAPLRALLPALGNPVQGLPFTVLSAADGQPAGIRLGGIPEAELTRLLRSISVPNGSNMK